MNETSAGNPHEVTRCYLCGGSGRLHLIGLPDRLFAVPGSWNFKICEQCGLYWLTPRLENLSEAYADYCTHQGRAEDKRVITTIRDFVQEQVAAVSYGSAHQVIHPGARALARMLSWIGPIREAAGSALMWQSAQPPGRVLDIGCGSGSFLARMERFGWEVSGLDFDDQAVCQARRHCSSQAIYTGSLEDMPFPDLFFDLVTMNHVLEHLPDPLRTLRQVFPLLRQGGRLVATTPNPRSLARALFHKNWIAWEAPRHLFLFKAPALRECARMAGFKSISVTSRSSMAGYNFFASQTIRRKGTLPGAVNPRPSALDLAQILLFWSTEYLLNKVRKVGEELVLVAEKTEQT